MVLVLFDPAGEVERCGDGLDYALLWYCDPDQTIAGQLVDGEVGYGLHLDQ